MQVLTRVVFCVLALAVAVGCASTEVIERDSKLGTENLPRPDRIYVYPFAAIPADIPTWSAAAGRYAPPRETPTPEELESGRELGALVVKELVTKIADMGLVAAEGNQQSQPQLTDIMLMGYFEAVEEGSTVKRLALGFGAGATALTTVVEGYQMTQAGPRLLGSGKLEATGAKTPGMVVPLAIFAATRNPIGLFVIGGAKGTEEVTGKSKIEGGAKRTAEAIADQLRVRFNEQGWIQ